MSLKQISSHHQIIVTSAVLINVRDIYSNFVFKLGDNVDC